jgi:F-type H+-transporting ATPase subunit delta
MSSTITLARPYAKAAFELAQKTPDGLASWSAKIAQSAALCRDSRILALVSSPRLQAKDRVALLLPQGEAAGSNYTHYLSAMAENDRLSLLPDVQTEFEQLRATAERTLKVKVRSAMPIEAAQQQQLIDKLAQRFQRAVTLEITLQPDLIGGAVLDAGAIVIDGSLSGKLARMHTELAA